MEPLLTTRTEDLPGLVMENELLRYEVTHLRARLAAAEQEAQVAQARAARVARVEAAEDAVAADGVDAAGLTARADLVWLLSRLESSPAARLLRRRPRYRELVERYLGAGPHDG